MDDKGGGLSPSGRRLAPRIILVVALVIVGTSWAISRITFSGVIGTAPERVVHVDSATRRTLLETADRFLETDPRRPAAHSTILADELGLTTKVFCREELIEVRRKDPHLLLGIVAWCEGLARSGNELVSGGGYITELLLTMEPAANRWTVRAVEEPGDGSTHLTSVVRMFSPGGASDALALSRAGSDMEDVRAQARRSFGLPPDAKVRTL